VQVARGFADVSTRFRAAVSGSGVRSATFDDFFATLVADASPADSWSAALNELELLIGIEVDQELTTEAIPTLARLGFKVSDAKRMATRLTPDGWLEVALTPIADQPHFEYQRKPGEFIDFAVASAGQRATALLKILLNQSGSPLLIDQPEEDLDSQVIQEVVTRLWEAKTRRQIIFASHNANLVVNGDAELVLCCDYRAVGDQSGGQVKLQGAIDVSDVREEITRVMEGGEKAFRLRKEKYGF
jgi:type III restriction enzyme